MSVAIRQITEDEYHNQALALWNECFPEDSNGFSDFYFARRSRFDYVLALFDGDDMRSMLHMIPYPLILQGKIRDCRMVAGVATSIKHRNHGYAGMLLTEANRVMKASGVYAAVLQPFDTAYYAKFGYKPLSSLKECKISSKALINSNVKLFMPDANAIKEIYDNYINRYNAIMPRSIEYCQLIIDEAQTDGGFIYTNGSSYAKGWLDGEGALVCELVGENTDTLIQGLLSRYSCLTVRVPVDSTIPCDSWNIKTFNMINVFDEANNVNDDVKLNYSLEYY